MMLERTPAGRAYPSTCPTCLRPVVFGASWRARLRQECLSCIREANGWTHDPTCRAPRDHAGTCDAPRHARACVQVDDHAGDCVPSPDVR